MKKSILLNNQTVMNICRDIKKGFVKIKLYILLFRLNKPFLAIPFAVTAAFLASATFPDYAKLLGLIVAAFGGFMAGNAFNAITDIDIDRNNPRTADRPLANNSLTFKEVFCGLIVAVIIVIVGTMIIDWKYVILLPIPIGLCMGYSLSKRYTWLCHLILGITNAICPVAGWGIFSTWFDWKLVLIGAIVCFWTIGFELIYSSQDIEYDKKSKMKSIPSVFGIKVAHLLSMFCHLIMHILLFVLIYEMKLSPVFCIGVLTGALFLVWEHFLVKEGKVTNPTLAFNLNQIYSLWIMFFSIIENIF